MLRPGAWWKPPLGLMLFILGALLMAGAISQAFSLGASWQRRQVDQLVGKCFGLRVLPRDTGRILPRP